MKARLLIIAALGVALAVYLLKYVGWGGVLAAAAALGWGGFVIICLYSLALFVLRVAT